MAPWKDNNANVAAMKTKLHYKYKIIGFRAHRLGFLFKGPRFYSKFSLTVCLVEGKSEGRAGKGKKWEGKGLFYFVWL